MKKISEIMAEFTAGKKTLEETNQALREAGSENFLNPSKNTLTAEEIAATQAETAQKAGGFGLLDTGTGSYDKVEVKDGKLVNADCGRMKAFCLIGGKRFSVSGDTLAD